MTTADGPAPGAAGPARTRSPATEAPAAPSALAVDADAKHSDRAWWEGSGRGGHQGRGLLARGGAASARRRTRPTRTRPTSLPFLFPVLYTILDAPPWPTTIALGVQHYLTMLGATVSMPVLVVPALGGSRADLARCISSLMVTSGIITGIQTFVGDRLPALQGGAFAYVPAVLAVGAQVAARGGFPDDAARYAASVREVSGACIGAGAVVAAVSASGALRAALRFVTPLVVASNIAVVGLGLYAAGVPAAASCWALSAPTAALLLVFALHLRRVRVPFGRGRSFPLFQSYPVVLAIALAWGGGAIASAAGAWDGAAPETRAACEFDVRALADAPWFRVPYPFWYGAPIFAWPSTLTMLAGALPAMVQSVGDYYATARVSGAPPPPPAVVARAVTVQGLTCAFAGAMGTLNGSTIYNENVAALLLTRCGSRRVVRAAAAVVVVAGVLAKISAAFASVPPAAVAGLFTVMFGAVAGVGLGQLQCVPLASSRNALILGVSICVGLSVPAYANDPKYASTGGPVATGSPGGDAVANALLKSGAASSLALALILDATAPATPGERGVEAWHGGAEDGGPWWRDERLARVYGLPCGVSVALGEAGLRWRARVGAALGRARRCARGEKKKEDGGEEGGGAGASVA